MEPLLNLPRDQFLAALAELQLDPERTAFLVEQYDQANAPAQGAGRRGMMYNLLDNIIGYDDDIVTPGERFGAGVQDFASGLLSDPLGTGAQMAREGYETIERAMAPGATPMDVLGAAGMAMGAGGLAARPAGSVGMGGRIPQNSSLRNMTREEFLGSPRITRPSNAASLRPRALVGFDEIDPDDFPIGNLRARYNEDGAAVYDGDKVVASYNFGDTLVVDPRYRRQGIGEELVYQWRTRFPGPGAARDRTRASQRIQENVWERIQREMADDELSANRSTTGLLAASAADTPAQQVARLLREGRAADVTDDLMAQADPQEMYQLYVTGQTGMDLPMDEASRMARAAEMGFAPDSLVYHGTNADIAALDPSRAGQVGADFGSASYASTSPRVSSGYAGQATGNPQWRALSEQHDAALSDWGRAVVQYGPGAPEAAQAQSRAQNILDEMNAIQADVEAFRAPSEGGNVMPLLANESGFPRYAGEGSNWYNANDAAISDARAAGASGLRIENVIDPATTPTSEIADTVVSFDPSRFRSRFARFDPRLSHLANLNAANIDPLTGAAAMGASQQSQDPLANLRAYLDAYGGLLGR